MAATGIRIIRTNNCGETQDTVDSVLERLYLDRALFTYTTPLLDISGTSNEAPSGTYQDGDPPTTGKEYWYEIVNDPENEGFKKWSVTANS